MAAKAAMARRKQRIIEERARKEAEPLNLSPDEAEISAASSGEGETLVNNDPEPSTGKGRGSDVLDDLLDDVFENENTDITKCVSDLSISPKGSSDNAPSEAGGSVSTESGAAKDDAVAMEVSESDDGEPVLPSEASAAAAEEDKKKRQEDKMKAYRSRRFKKKEKTLKRDETSEAMGASGAQPETTAPPAASSSSTVPSASDDTQPKKKFEGIAKVRRRKIREEQKKLEAAGETEEEIVEVLLKKAKTAAGGGRALELMIIVFFLVTGYIIGYNSIVNSSSDIVVAGMDGVVDMGGVGDEEIDKGMEEMRKLKDELMSSDSGSFFLYDSTIDPIFGVDFDLLLMEDTTLNTIGRFAVGLHRTATKVARVPYDLFVPKTWPIFCGISMAIRVGTWALLGATGMQTKVGAKKDSKGIKEMAMGFVRDMFPVIFGCWELYQLVIGDVLMMFTGVLFAMATASLVGGQQGLEGGETKGGGLGAEL